MIRGSALVLTTLWLVMGASFVSADTKEARVLKEFPSYQHPLGKTARSIVIAPNPSLDALVALARRLHRDDPTSMITIFTDGNAQRFERYRLWDIHRMKPDAARYPAPKAWADRHEIAVIQEFVDQLEAPRRWRLLLFRGSAVRPPVKDGHEVDLEGVPGVTEPNMPKFHNRW